MSEEYSLLKLLKTQPQHLSSNLRYGYQNPKRVFFPCFIDKAVPYSSGSKSQQMVCDVIVGAGLQRFIFVIYNIVVHLSLKGIYLEWLFICQSSLQVFITFSLCKYIIFLSAYMIWSIITKNQTFLAKLPMMNSALTQCLTVSH